MHTISPSRVWQGEAQVVTFGNVYESDALEPYAYDSLGELLTADERHLSQKAAYWLTPYGFPLVTVCSTALDAPARLLPTRAFVCPARVTSSVCLDFLRDPEAQAALLARLDARVPVHLAGYSVSRPLQAVARWFVERGFTLAGWSDATVELAARYGSKAAAHEELFAASPALAALRPACWVIRDSGQVCDTILRASQETGIQGWVLKSARSSGGEGVFFLQADQAQPGMSVEALLQSQLRGYSKLNGPFVLEARVPHVASPTADIFVKDDGEVLWCGVAAQRLLEGRYYYGFYKPSLARLAQTPWLGALRAASLEVGRVAAAQGYAGFLNLDFVVDAQARLALIEVNPRRSALQDALSFAQFVAGEVGLDGLEVASAEYVPTRLARAEEGVREGEAGLVAPLLRGGFDSAHRWLGLVSVSQGDGEEALALAVERASGLPHEQQGVVIGAAQRWPGLVAG